MSIEIKTCFNRKNKNGERRTDLIDADEYYTPIVDGKEYSHMAETQDIAYLIGLGIKYDGINSQFVKMACRMLNIKSNWAK